MWITKEAYCTFAIKRPWPFIQTWPCGPAFDWICSLFGLTVIWAYLNNMPSVYYTTNKHLEGCIYNFPSKTQHFFKARHWIEKIRYFVKSFIHSFENQICVLKNWHCVLTQCVLKITLYSLWLLKWKPFKSITKHLMSGPLVKQLFLFPTETLRFLRWLKRTVFHKTWHYMYMYVYKVTKATKTTKWPYLNFIKIDFLIFLFHVF